jgi:hypothetical protein
VICIEIGLKEPKKSILLRPKPCLGFVLLKKIPLKKIRLFKFLSLRTIVGTPFMEIEDKTENNAYRSSGGFHKVEHNLCQKKRSKKNADPNSPKFDCFIAEKVREGRLQIAKADEGPERARGAFGDGYPRG